MVYDQYTQQRIILLNQHRLKAPEIAKLVSSESTQVTMQGAHESLCKLRATGTIAKHTGSGRPSKIIDAIKAVVDQQMVKDDETTAVQLYELLQSNAETKLSMSTILHCRSSLGWTFRDSAYW